MTSKSKKEWLGKMAIYIDRRTKEPLVVYIDDTTTDGILVAYAVNGRNSYFVDETELQEFDFWTCRRMRSDWKLQDLKRQVRMIELRKSL